MTMGGHYIKSWASTQKGVTLSSGEAELVAAVKRSTELIGLIQLAKDWRVKVGGKVMVDSSAALGVVRRKGNGKLRHVRVGKMWIQEKEESGELMFGKVKGELNPADLMTKGLCAKVMGGHMGRIGQEVRGGRAEAGLKLNYIGKVGVGSERTGKEVTGREGHKTDGLGGERERERERG